MKMSNGRPLLNAISQGFFSIVLDYFKCMRLPFITELMKNNFSRHFRQFPTQKLKLTQMSQVEKFYDQKIRLCKWSCSQVVKCKVCSGQLVLGTQQAHRNINLMQELTRLDSTRIKEEKKKKKTFHLKRVAVQVFNEGFTSCPK